MKKIISILLVILSVMANAQSLKGKKILVFSKTAAFVHDCIPEGNSMFLKLAVDEKMKIDTTRDANFFTDKQLKKYDVVVFLNTTGDILNPEQEAAFQRFIQSGKGFLGIHSATDTEYEWPWYFQLVGAYFKSHPKQQAADYVVLDNTHSSVSFWPARFNTKQEIYNFKAVKQEGLHFVLAVDEKTYEGGSMPDFHPAAWYQTFDGGRAYYTALGHMKESYTDAGFIKHIIGALQWLTAK